MSNHTQQRFCKHCRTYKPCEAFYVSKKGFYSQYCKECHREISRRKWKETHPPSEAVKQEDGTYKWVKHSDFRTKIRWTDEMNKQLQELFPHKSYRELSAIFGLSIRSVSRQANRLNLFRRKVRKDTEVL